MEPLLKNWLSAKTERLGLRKAMRPMVTQKRIQCVMTEMEDTIDVDRPSSGA